MAVLVASLAVVLGVLAGCGWVRARRVAVPAAGVRSRWRCAGVALGCVLALAAGVGSVRTPAAAGTLPVEGTLPALAGATGWLNSAPLTPAALRGKVVLVDFWTYSCINCLRALPYVEAWAQKYQAHGLVVIGVHTPEFPFEKNPANVRAAVHRLGVRYPVAIDSNYAIWRAFNNQFWPADYFIDARGRVRAHSFGEGGYREAEDVIRKLLAEAGYANLPGGYVDPQAAGAEAAAGGDLQRSPETYVGYDRAAGFTGGELLPDQAFDYRAPAKLAVNQWSLAGRWTVQAQAAVLQRAGGSIRYHFRGRDLHLVLGPDASGKPVRFRITVDGHAPGADHGADVDAAGAGVVTAQRLYQLVRQAHGDGARSFTITFLDPGVHAYAFTFG